MNVSCTIIVAGWWSICLLHAHMAVYYSRAVAPMERLPQDTVYSNPTSENSAPTCNGKNGYSAGARAKAGSFLSGIRSECVPRADIVCLILASVSLCYLSECFLFRFVFSLMMWLSLISRS